MFKIVHSGGYCFKYGDNNNVNDWHFRLRTDCDLFHMEKTGCIRHIASQKYLKYIESGSTVLQSECGQTSPPDFYKREVFSTISRNQKFFVPWEKKENPSYNYGIIMLPLLANMQIFEFYFKQGEIVYFS